MANTLPTFLSTHPDTVLVEIIGAKGSTPREAGAFMLVAEEACFGTIGGGQLEFMAIDHAQALLRGEDKPLELDIPLGPEIGQCCGGRVALSFERVDMLVAARLVAKDLAKREEDPDVFLFGAGHVGLALAQALAPLPVRVTIVETRPIAETLPAGVNLRHIAMPEAEVASIGAGGAAIILTHDHALDFLIANEALAREDLAYVGMIGSTTKRATFASWLAREGVPEARLEQLILPIGGKTVRDKRPAVIAAMVAAELMAALAR